MSMKRIAILASGRGSNFQAIVDAIQRGEINAECTRLITDNPKAYALDRAKRAGIPCNILNFSLYPDRKAYELALFNTMLEVNPDLFVLCGYMRLLDPAIVRAFERKIINIHPALLPSFPGLHAQRQTLEYGVKVSGCSVHFVDEGTDTGPIIIQRCVAVLDADDEETLAARILVQEHLILVEAVKLFLDGRLFVKGRRVFWKQ